jgi:hypothetical protein
VKKKVSKKSKSKKEEQNDKAKQIHKEEKSFDFGGLPDRDLKKNLGCG